MKNIFDILLEPFNSQESIEYNAFLEIPTLHLPFGQSYTEPDVNSSQTPQPDTLKSSFLIRDHLLFVEKIDFDNNIIEAYEIINYEPDKIKEDKKRQLRNNYESDEQLEEGMKDIQYEKKERIKYSLKINPRIPEKVNYEYENIMNMKGVQLYKFERITVELIKDH